MNERQKMRWETVMLIGLMSILAVGFVATIVVMVRAPRVISVDVEDPDIGSDTAGEARTTFRRYNRPLTVHSLQDAIFKPVALVEPGPSTDKISDYRPASSTKNFSMDAIADFRPAAPVRPQKDEGFLDEKEEKSGTGWGWLADDIASVKKGRDQAGKIADQEKEQKELDDEEDAGLVRREPLKEELPFFASRAFESNTQRDPVALANRPDDRSRYIGEARVDEKGRGEMETQDETGGESRDRAATGDSFTAMLSRDPFSPREDSATDRRFGEASWGLANADDVLMRSRGGIDEDTRGSVRSERDVRGFAPAQRVEEPTVWSTGDRYNDASRGSSGRNMYGSDAYFNSGGGYSPQAISISSSEGAFSGGGVFGGASSYSVATPAIGGSDFSTPIGSSYTPSPAGSSSGGARLGSEPATPRTLPW